jgi:hypothetical protein
MSRRKAIRNAGNRVLGGGAAPYDAWVLRSTVRNRSEPELRFRFFGFRLIAREVENRGSIENPYIDKYEGFQSRRKGFDPNAPLVGSALTDATKVVSNMVLYWGLIANDELITDPGRIESRFYNTRIIPDEWARGTTSDPILWLGRSWVKLADMSYRDWTRYKKSKPVELARGYERNLRPYR